jgi:uncharacterized caspase-like protein
MFGLVIVDACRNNPFVTRMATTDPSRGVGRGLGRVEPAKGVLVAYAARDGEIAQDGEGANSPFATALGQFLTEPGLEVSLLFRKVHDAVLEQTGGQQEPFTYGALPAAELYWRPRGALHTFVGLLGTV